MNEVSFIRINSPDECRGKSHVHLIWGIYGVDHKMSVAIDITIPGNSVHTIADGTNGARMKDGEGQA